MSTPATHGARAPVAGNKRVHVGIGPELHAAIGAVAAQLSGTDVITCVYEATDIMWDAGYDHDYQTRVQNEGVTEENADRFHSQWLTILLHRLQLRTNG